MLVRAPSPRGAPSEVTSWGPPLTLVQTVHLSEKAGWCPHPRPHQHLAVWVSRHKARGAILSAPRSSAPDLRPGQRRRLMTGPHLIHKEIGERRGSSTGPIFTGHCKPRIRHRGLEDHLVRGPPGAREHLCRPKGKRAPCWACPSWLGAHKISLVDPTSMFPALRRALTAQN